LDFEDAKGKMFSTLEEFDYLRHQNIHIVEIPNANWRG
jgi:hypothetical protein